MSHSVKNRAIALVISVLVFASGKQHVLLNVKVEKAEGRLLVVQNCTISKEPAVPIAAFLLNNKSLENIRSSNESCSNSLGECQPQECECGVNYFIHIMTLPLEKPLYNFTCIVRFNEIFKGVINHVVYQDSIFYNSSGMYPLNETKEVIGQPSPKEKPQSPNEQDNSDHWILVSLPIILGLASPIIVICIYKKQRCFKKEKQKRIPTKTKNFDREDTNRKEACAFLETDEDFDREDTKRKEACAFLETDEDFDRENTNRKEACAILENDEDYQDPTTESKVLTERKHTAVVQIEQPIDREQTRVHFHRDYAYPKDAGQITENDEEEKSISNAFTSTGVNLLSDENKTVALAIKSARSIAVNPLDDENIKLVCTDRKDMKESDDGEEEKVYPPELNIDTI